MTGSAGQQRVSTDFVRNYPIVLPPILEQQAIALMQEYRTRLTADIVTGKLDVREAAARLPEVKSDQSDESDQSDLSELSDESDPSDPSDLSDETGDSHLEDEP